MQDQLVFYISFGSPFSYIASQRVDEIVRKYNIGVLWRPVRLRNVLDSIYSDLGGFRVPEKKLKYMRQDSIRMAKFHCLPFIPPESKPPFDCDEAYSCAYALADGDEDVLRNVCMAMSSSIWQKGQALKDSDDIVRSLSNFNSSKSLLIDCVNNSKGKVLHENTVNEAVEIGMIGSPWFYYQGESFWGNDRLELIDFLFSNTR